MSNVWLKQYDESRVAVVVAHPDDEVLWFGGLLAWSRNNISVPIDVICCSIPETEPERAMKFQDACRCLGARYKLLPVTEARGGHLKHLDWLSLAPYDVVFTHNFTGEYGHLHHIDVHDFVRRRFDGPIYVSGYGTEEGVPIQFDWNEKLEAIKHYNHMSKLMGVPKYKELLARWGTKFDLTTERYKCEN